jgi:hypothetical protein
VLGTIVVGFNVGCSSIWNAVRVRVVGKGVCCLVRDEVGVCVVGNGVSICVIGNQFHFLVVGKGVGCAL